MRRLLFIFSREPKPSPERCVIVEGETEFPIDCDYARYGEAHGFYQYLSSYNQGKWVIHRFIHCQ